LSQRKPLPRRHHPGPVFEQLKTVLAAHPQRLDDFHPIINRMRKSKKSHHLEVLIINIKI